MVCKVFWRQVIGRVILKVVHICFISFLYLLKFYILFINKTFNNEMEKWIFKGLNTKFQKIQWPKENSAEVCKQVRPLLKLNEFVSVCKCCMFDCLLFKCESKTAMSIGCVRMSVCQSFTQYFNWCRNRMHTCIFIHVFTCKV